MRPHATKITPYRFALALLMFSLLGVSLSLWQTRQTLLATQGKLIETQGENAIAQEQVRVLSSRLGNIERGVTIPAGTRKAIRQMQEQGTPLAP